MKRSIAFVFMLAFSATVMAAEPAKPFVNMRQMAEGLSNLSDQQLHAGSQEMKSWLARAFPAKRISANSSDVTCVRENECHWYGKRPAGSDDEPSPWPDAFVWFEKGMLVGVTTSSPSVLEKSPNWQCHKLKGLGYIIDCFPAAIPKQEQVKRMRKTLHRFQTAG